MSFFNRLLATWRTDPLLRRVVKNSSYLFSSNSLGILLSLLTSILATRALTEYGYGVLGAIQAFAMVADKLLSFRIGELVIKYTGGALAQGNRERAAAVFKSAALTEMGVSMLSFALIAVLAPLGALWFAKDAALAPLFVAYGLIVPAGLLYETSSALLQVGGNFREQAAINLIQNIVTVGVVALAFFTGAGLPIILIAYLMSKALMGASYAMLAFARARELFGRGWWRVSFQHLPPAREFWGFAFSSNFSGTVNLFVRDSDILWINYLLSPVEGGYYKLAAALIGYMLIPVDPLIKTSFPEITRAVAERAWGHLKNLLRRLTLISGAITLAFGLAMVILAEPFIFRYLYEPRFLPALVPALILWLGYGLANTLFWNRPLVLAFGHATFPLVVTTLVGLGKIALMLLLVPRYGMNAQAALMSAYFLVSIGLIAWRGVAEISYQSKIVNQKS